MVKHIISLLAIFFISHSGLASHLLGGEITWECDKTSGQTNSGKFRFTVIIYRECGGTFFNDPSVTLQGGPSGSIVCNRVGAGVNVSPTCYSGQLSCTTPSGEGRMEEHTFRSSWISLSGTPPATGWEFWWQQCCRPGGPGGGGLTNNSLSTSQSYYLRATMYPYTPAAAGAPLSVSTCYDSSPQFAEKPKSIICMGYDYTFSQNAYEPDFDSVYYSWVAPQGSQGPLGALSYTGGYSVTNPFPNYGNPVGFTPTSGLVTINPDVSGSFMSCIKVESYRCNQKISEIYRDVALVIKGGCEATGTGSTNLPPKLLLDSIPGSSNQIVVPVKTYSGYGTDTVYQADVYPGDVVKFRLTATDNQFSPFFNFQNVNFNANSAQIYNSAIPNSCANPPCAYVTPVAPATSFTNSLSLKVDFEWEIACNHLSITNSCGFRSNSYFFPLKMQDDACPAPAQKEKMLIVTVHMPVFDEPDTLFVQSASNSNVNVSWALPVDTSSDFQGYQISFSNAQNGPYIPLDTIFQYGQNNYSLNPQAIGTGWLFVKTIGPCGLLSSPSNAVIIQSCVPTITSNLSPTDTVYTTQSVKLLQIITPNCINTFQWQLDDGSGWQYLQDNSIYSGTLTSALLITGIDTSFNENKYRCIVGGVGVSDTSTATTLYVINNIGIFETEIEFEGIIAPNPNDGHFTLEVEESIVGSEYELTDELGRLIEKGKIESTSQDFDLLSKPKGVYRLSIKSTNGIKTMAVVVQ